jgi:predicted permease
MAWFRRLRSTFVGSRMEKEFDEETVFHLEQRTAEYVRDGMSVDEARRAARRRLGNLTLAREQVRDVDTLRWLQDFSHDLRHAARSLRRAPAFAAAAILTFTLGIGANAAIFSVVYGVLLRPLPYKDPETLVLIQTRDRLTGRVNPSGFSGPDLNDWTERTRAFESLALVSREVFALETQNGFETVSGAHVSGHFFSILEAPLAVGRSFNDVSTPEIVISDRLWRRSFARDPNVVGRHVRLNSQPYTIVGVTAADFELPIDTRRNLGAPAQPPDLWAPVQPASGADDRRLRYYQFVARLAPGITLAQARSDAESVAHSISAEFAPIGQGFEPVVIPVADELTGGSRPALLVLLGAVGLVLLVACANVANLLLARQSSRLREIAIRVSLGASRQRLMIQLLAEASLLAVFGGLGGILLTNGIVAGLRWVEPPEVPRLDAIRVDMPVLAFALAISTLAALVAAAAPAFQFLKREASLTLRPSGQTHTVGGGTRRLHSALVVSELALSLILLVGAALLSRSFVNLLRTDVGATTDHVVAVELNLAMGRMLSETRQIQLTDQLIDGIRRLPGVLAVGAANGLPPNRTRMAFEFEMPDRPDGMTGLRRYSLVNPTPDYFSALGIQLLRGRLFSGADGPDAPRVVIVSAGVARQLFGTVDVVGRSLPIGPKRAPVPIVGVVGDVKYGGLEAAAPEPIYLPFTQRPFRNMTLVARTSGDPRPMAASLERAIHAVDREITRGPARALDDVVSEAVAQPRFRTALLSLIAGLALMLAAVGLYGVVAYGVSQRTVEIGVRMALGANDAKVIGMVLREAFTLALAGAAIGTVGAYLLTRTLTRFLYGVTPTDGLSFVLAVASLMAMTALASYIPARRATQVDPVMALRYE